jgi:hypothetical protein
METKPVSQAVHRSNLYKQKKDGEVYFNLEYTNTIFICILSKFKSFKLLDLNSPQKQIPREVIHDNSHHAPAVCPPEKDSAVPSIQRTGFAPERVYTL